MRHLVDPRQQRLMDPFDGVIAAAGWTYIANSWQGVVRHVVLEQLPVAQLGKHFAESMGRPSKELHAMAGLVLIKEFHHWTVEQTYEAVLFRSDVQYALNLEPAFSISQRTIERYLALFQGDDDLAGEIMACVTDDLATRLELKVSQQRLDSTHVLSDMASFGRTRLMGVAIKRFLAQVQRHTPTDFEAMPEDFRGRYVASDKRLFADAGKQAESRAQTRQQVAEDLRWIIERFADHATHQSRPAYRALLTIFGEQCELVVDKVVVKTKTGGDVMQNPSDPDATYSGHKGPGYQVQLSETCQPDNEAQLIMSAIPQTAVTTDGESLPAVLEDLQTREQLPETMRCDAAYGSDENVQSAATRSVEIISPVCGRKEQDTPDALGPEDFRLDPATNTATACPAGHAPIESRYIPDTDRVTVKMPVEMCASCPLRNRCPIEVKKAIANLYFTTKEHRVGVRRASQETVEFKARYAPRSGIESTNSGLKRRTGLKRLRVRGHPAVRVAILLRVTGWNILQASRTLKLRAVVCERMVREGHGGLFSANFDADYFHVSQISVFTPFPKLILAVPPPTRPARHPTAIAIAA